MSDIIKTLHKHAEEINRASVHNSLGSCGWARTMTDAAEKIAELTSLCEMKGEESDSLLQRLIRAERERDAAYANRDLHQELLEKKVDEIKNLRIQIEWKIIKNKSNLRIIKFLSERLAEAEKQKPVAYCDACNSVGMMNCSDFVNCGQPKCVTCKLPLDRPIAPASDERVKELEAVIRECSEYLETNKYTTIGRHANILHRQMRAALAASKEATCNANN